MSTSNVVPFDDLPPAAPKAKCRRRPSNLAMISQRLKDPRWKAFDYLTRNKSGKTIAFKVPQVVFDFMKDAARIEKLTVSRWTAVTITAMKISGQDLSGLPQPQRKAA